MDTPDNGASYIDDDLPSDWEQPDDGPRPWEPNDPGANDEAEDILGRDLAGYAFLREDDDREVRLYFRDAPANELALAFRKAGALLISITGERALRPASAPSPISPIDQSQAEPQARKRRRRKSASDIDAATDPGSARSRHTGELTVRYFYVLEDIVYTIIIASSAGMIESIAGIYPQAALSEQELHTRLAAIFRS